MACRAKELISVFHYNICNPERSDYKIEEHVEEVEELKSDAEEVNRLKTILEVEELRLKTLLDKVKAESKRLENNGGPLEKKKKYENANEEVFLPSDVMVVILSRLSLKDNIRSSAVCKTWGQIAASVRVRDPPCWLMYLDPYCVTGVSYGFYDPVEKKKTKAMSLPELSKSSRILCSNDGWLLMNESAQRLFFFNPFTRERINLPRFDILLSRFAFSCAPTKKGCLVFGVNIGVAFVQSITISTWHPGATTWVYEDFPNLPSYSRHTKNVLYSGGLFYISTEIALGIFDPSARTWNILPVQPIHGPITEKHKIMWIAEYIGHIFLVDAPSAELKVFRLNLLESVWEKNETLDGSSVFVSNGSCVMTSGLTGSMSNIVCVWHNDINRRRPNKYYCRNRPYKYSLYSKSLCEDPEGFYFEHQIRTWIDGVWIEPHHNISIFDFPILEASDAVITPFTI